MRVLPVRALPALATVLLLAAMLAPACAGELGDDGLHKEPWFSITFKDMSEDLKAAKEQGKRLAVIFEQRGCSYCKKLHEEVLSDPMVSGYIKDHYMVVQINLFGDEEVTDFDGTALPEKEMGKRWDILFTPTILFMPDRVPDTGNAGKAAVATMPGAFGKGTTLDMFEWVVEKGYKTDEQFQRYHARKSRQRQDHAQ